MRRNHQSQEEQWWHEGREGAAPGNVVPILGAGISIDPPTCLPDGTTLTKALVRHLLDERVSSEILTTFQRCDGVLGRSVPRLEHLLSAAAQAEPQSLQLLNIFKDVKPNRNHAAIARHLMEKRGWAITTNFDEAIEQAGNYSIPVHTFDPDCASIKVAYGDQDAKWGLVKLHGSIGQGVERLGATLEAITPGLPEPLRELFNQILDDADFLVVAGYSASDHFDVNAFLRTKLNDCYNARLIWLDHSDGSNDEKASKENIGRKTFEFSCNGHHPFYGNTHEHLAQFLGVEMQPVPSDGGVSWDTKMVELYHPTVCECHKIGAYLAAAMGYSTIIQESIAQLRRAFNDEHKAKLVEAKSYALEGRWGVASSILKHPSLKKEEQAAFLNADMLRKSGHPIRSLFHHVLRRGCRKDEKVRMRIETACCLLDLYRSLMWMPLSHTRVARGAWNWLISRQLNAVRKYSESVVDPMHEARYQLMHVRREAYCVDYFKFGNPMELRNLIEDEVSYPQLYVRGIPIFPGYYLSSATTTAELDNLPEVLDVRLAYADALAVCARRSYLGTFSVLTIAAVRIIHGKARAQHKKRHEIHMPVEIMVCSIKDQLEKAAAVAEMLDCDYARNRVAKAWLRADKMMWGFNNWKRQRLYLA